MRLLRTDLNALKSFLVQGCEMKHGDEVSFKPPTGGWGLLGVLKLLADNASTADCVAWMKDPMGHPALPADTLLVCKI